MKYASCRVSPNFDQHRVIHNEKNYGFSTPRAPLISVKVGHQERVQSAAQDTGYELTTARRLSGLDAPSMASRLFLLQRFPRAQYRTSCMPKLYSTLRWLGRNYLLFRVKSLRIVIRYKGTSWKRDQTNDPALLWAQSWKANVSRRKTHKGEICKCILT